MIILNSITFFRIDIFVCQMCLIGKKQVNIKVKIGLICNNDWDTYLCTNIFSYINFKITHNLTTLNWFFPLSESLEWLATGEKGLSLSTENYICIYWYKVHGDCVRLPLQYFCSVRARKFVPGALWAISKQYST